MLASSILIKGLLYSRQDLFIDCELSGAIDASNSRVTIGPEARVEGSIKALELIVMGTVCGDIEAGNRFEVRAGAHFAGDVVTSRIVIEEGAHFSGHIEMDVERWRNPLEGSLQKGTDCSSDADAELIQPAAPLVELYDDGVSVGAIKCMPEFFDSDRIARIKLRRYVPYRETFSRFSTATRKRRDHSGAFGGNSTLVRRIGMLLLLRKWFPNF